MTPYCLFVTVVVTAPVLVQEFPVTDGRNTAGEVVDMDVSHNRIPSIPGDVARYMNQVKTLNASHNCLDSLPEQVLCTRGPCVLRASWGVGEGVIPGVSEASSLPPCKHRMVATPSPTTPAPAHPPPSHPSRSVYPIAVVCAHCYSTPADSMIDRMLMVPHKSGVIVHAQAGVPGCAIQPH